LRTDASTRFEQALSPELAVYGMCSVIELIQKIAGGELIGYVDEYPEKQKPMYTHVSVEKINRILGVQLTGAEVANAFIRLGFSYKEEAGLFEVMVPFERLDLLIAEDLIEEVVRMVGYDTVPPVSLPLFVKKPEIHAPYAAAERARAELISKGYSEVFTSVFADQGDVVVLNKIDSVRPALRTNLTDGLTEALTKNKPNKDLLGLKEIKLFEIGTVWKGGAEEVLIGTITEKEKASEKKLEAVEVGVYENLPLSAATRFEPFSKYPYIVRDIAMWVPADSDAAAMRADIHKELGTLAHKVSLFDTFTKDNRTSLAFRIIFQSFDRTLTEGEVQPLMERLSLFFKTKGFEVR
jgi:phenylalanyl-tRNA synthetase beta subunit